MRLFRRKHNSATFFEWPNGDHEILPSIISKGWTISPTGNLSLRSVSINQTRQFGNAIETTNEQGLHISPFDRLDGIRQRDHWH